MKLRFYRDIQCKEGNSDCNSRNNITSYPSINHRLVFFCTS